MGATVIVDPQPLRPLAQASTALFDTVVERFAIVAPYETVMLDPDLITPCVFAVRVTAPAVSVKPSDRMFCAKLVGKNDTCAFANIGRAMNIARNRRKLIICSNE